VDHNSGCLCYDRSKANQSFRIVCLTLNGRFMLPKSNENSKRMGTGRMSQTYCQCARSVPEDQLLRDAVVVTADKNRNWIADGGLQHRDYPPKHWKQSCLTHTVCDDNLRSSVERSGTHLEGIQFDSAFRITCRLGQASNSILAANDEPVRS